MMKNTPLPAKRRDPPNFAILICSPEEYPSGKIGESISLSVLLSQATKSPRQLRFSNLGSRLSLFSLLYSSLITKL